jgi:hypothetical protein
VEKVPYFDGNNHEDTSSSSSSSSSSWRRQWRWYGCIIENSNASVPLDYSYVLSLPVPTKYFPTFRHKTASHLLRFTWGLFKTRFKTTNACTCPDCPVLATINWSCRTSASLFKQH